MKRRTVSEREDAQAREAAAKHRGDLLADLRAREVARRASPTAPEPVVSPDDTGLPGHDDGGQDALAVGEPPDAPEG